MSGRRSIEGECAQRGRLCSAVGSVELAPSSRRAALVTEKGAARSGANLDTEGPFAGEAVRNGWRSMVRDDGHNLARRELARNSGLALGGVWTRMSFAPRIFRSEGGRW